MSNDTNGRKSRLSRRRQNPELSKACLLREESGLWAVGMKPSKCRLCYLASCLVFGAGLAWHSAARADSEPPPLKIGVLDDMSGPNSENSGVGTVEAIKMAIEDYGGKVLGRPIELLLGTDQNKPDIAVSIAREWYTRDGVSMITGLPNSAS